MPNNIKVTGIKFNKMVKTKFNQTLGKFKFYNNFNIRGEIQVRNLHRKTKQ